MLTRLKERMKTMLRRAGPLEPLHVACAVPSGMGSLLLTGDPPVSNIGQELSPKPALELSRTNASEEETVVSVPVKHRTMEFRDKQQKL